MVPSGAMLVFSEATMETLISEWPAVASLSSHTVIKLLGPEAESDEET